MDGNTPGHLASGTDKRWQEIQSPTLRGTVEKKQIQGLVLGLILVLGLSLSVRADLPLLDVGNTVSVFQQRRNTEVCQLVQSEHTSHMWLFNL